MAMQRRLVGVIAACLMLASGAASAQTVRLEQYRHPSEPKFELYNKLYLAGLKDGLIVYTVRQDAKDRLFCLPPDWMLTTEQAEEIMLRFADKRQVPGNVPIGLPLLAGLREAYPCDKQ